MVERAGEIETSDDAATSTPTLSAASLSTHDGDMADGEAVGTGSGTAVGADVLGEAVGTGKGTTVGADVLGATVGVDVLTVLIEGTGVLGATVGTDVLAVPIEGAGVLVEQ